MYGRRHHHDCGPGAAGVLFLMLLFVVLALTLAVALLRVVNYAYKAIKR